MSESRIFKNFRRLEEALGILLIYQSKYLDQETAKGSFRSSSLTRCIDITLSSLSKDTTWLDEGIESTSSDYKHDHSNHHTVA